MSEIALLESLTELAILNKLQYKYNFEMSEFLSYGDLAALSAEKGYKVEGNIGGGNINGHYFGFGAISSVVLSEYLKQNLNEKRAMPMPVGFDNISAPKYKGAIAKQFSSAVPGGKTLEQADVDVVKAYLEYEQKPLDPDAAFQIWRVPGIPAKDLIKMERRTLNLDWSRLPNEFYARVQGDASQIELIKEICKDDGVACVDDNQDVYITNVDRGIYPPLASQLYWYDFDRKASKAEADDTPQPAISVKDGITSDQSQPNALPKVWEVMKSVPSIATYKAVCESAEFKRVVASNKQKLGSNKHKTTTKLLSYWQFEERKTVKEYLDLCARVYKDEQMQAKLFHAIISHLREDGDKLYRVDLGVGA